jgi:hypothetical protein
MPLADKVIFLYGSAMNSPNQRLVNLFPNSMSARKLSLQLFKFAFYLVESNDEIVKFAIHKSSSNKKKRTTNLVSSNNLRRQWDLT